MAELEAKRESQQLEIVAFGTISSGKSSLLNALAGATVFRTNVVGGTTVARSEIPWPAGDRVVLVDTPGLAEVRGESRAAEAAEAAKNADLVLFVVDGPLKAYESELLRRSRRWRSGSLSVSTKKIGTTPSSAMSCFSNSPSRCRRR